MFLRALTELYSWNLPRRLAAELETRHYSVPVYLDWFWHARSFSSRGRLSAPARFLAALLGVGEAVQVALGVGFLVEWARFGTVGSWEFGLALIISYPVVWAHLLAVGVWIYKLLYYIAHPKKAGRGIVCAVLERQVRVLRRKYPFKVIAVAGSVGKTSTKLAIAELLAQNLRVRHQTGNYNDRVTVPLVFFGHTEPGLFNVVAWLKLFGANQAMLAHPYPYDVVVVELGTDGPGQLNDFAYLQPDITVVTAVTPEHMEYFKTLDAVAEEELSVFRYSKRVLVNADDIAGKYLAGYAFSAYSLVSRQADYFATAKAGGLAGQVLDVTTPNGKIKTEVRYIGTQGAKYALAAAGVADSLDVKASSISDGLPKLSHFAGRMQVLPGVKGSTLIDDTYNSSPVPALAALDVLYAARASQRIAVLGSMNEMGAYSPEAHREVGAYCDPAKVDLVVTIGKDANGFLAPVAKEKGCTVKTFTSPYEAGAYVLSELKSGAVVLAKGSQNGVFAEEALKPLLANDDDAAKLVRQSPYWQGRKRHQFGKATSKGEA